MGTYNSRFFEALKTGSEEEARSLYSTKKSLRDSLEPNAPLGPSHGDNSVLHYAALHAFKWLYNDLQGRGGKPDVRNAAARNCLHLVCSTGNHTNRRHDILQMIIMEGLHGMDVEHVLRERDEEGNTALHLAAASGLKNCVVLLLDSRADPYVTNKKELTAADLASESKHSDIATLLETRMVFSTEEEGSSAQQVEPDHTHLMELAEAPSGMKDSDLRSMKDQLLIETSELLGVSLFTSEALLRHHGWSKEQLLEAWMDNPTEACEKAGVQLPANLGTHNLDTPSTTTSTTSPRENNEEAGGEEEEEGEEREGEEKECGVCVVSFTPDVQVPCGHIFCRDCWKEYLHQKIEAGDAHSIVCPEYGCFKLVPLEVIEAVVSREMAQRYLQFDIKAFVESHPTIRWCPYPDCHRAVRMTTPTDTPTDDRPTTVHCGNEHYFCWSCSMEPHVPMSCERWKTWLLHIQEMSSQIGDRTASQLDDAASQRWLATRSKPCPKCRAPIEKNDGCNHMCCKKCKHDFCWVCLDEWKLHNTATGGYFECNRFEVREKADTELKMRKEQVMEGLEEAENLRRFIHYYERYKNHKQNLQLELPFLEKANQKSQTLRDSVQKLESGSNQRRYTVSMDMSFIEEAIRELLSARRILIASYAFGYYVEGYRARRLFENIQGSVEQVTEQLAQVVARPHLRKPRSEIIRITSECREKRKWLVKDCNSLPEPTPPHRRRQRLLFGLRSNSHLGYTPSSSSSSSDDEDDHIRNDILRRLSGLPPPPLPPPVPPLPHHRRRHRHHRRRHERGGDRARQEQELQQVMELSRREHDEKTQLEADIERAKQLSLQETSVSTAQPTADAGLLFLGSQTTPPPPKLTTPPERGLVDQFDNRPFFHLPLREHFNNRHWSLPPLLPPLSSQQHSGQNNNTALHFIRSPPPPPLPPPRPNLQTENHSTIHFSPPSPSLPSTSSSFSSSVPPPPPPPPQLVEEEEERESEDNDDDDTTNSSAGGGWDEEEIARAMSLSLMAATPTEAPPP